MVTVRDDMQEIIEVTPPVESLLITHTHDHDEYKCSEADCSFTTSNPSLLGLHKAKKHNIKTGSKKGTTHYFCPAEGCQFNPQSGRFFKVLDHLKTHYTKVHCEKKFRCPKCGKAFSLERDCLRHDKVCGVTFTCDDCGKCYLNKWTLISHCQKTGHKQPACLQKAPKPVKLDSHSRSKVKKVAKKVTNVPIFPKFPLPDNMSILIPAAKEIVQNQPLNASTAVIETTPSNIIEAAHSAISNTSVLSASSEKQVSEMTSVGISSHSQRGLSNLWNGIALLSFTNSPNLSSIESSPNKNAKHHRHQIDLLHVSNTLPSSSMLVVHNNSDHCNANDGKFPSKTQSRSKRHLVSSPPTPSRLKILKFPAPSGIVSDNLPKTQSDVQKERLKSPHSLSTESAIRNELFQSNALQTSNNFNLVDEVSNNCGSNSSGSLDISGSVGGISVFNSTERTASLNEASSQANGQQSHTQTQTVESLINISNPRLSNCQIQTDLPFLPTHQDVSLSSLNVINGADNLNEKLLNQPTNVAITQTDSLIDELFENPIDNFRVDTEGRSYSDIGIGTHTNDLLDMFTQTYPSFDSHTQTVNNLDMHTQTGDYFDDMNQTQNNFDMFTQTSDIIDGLMQNVENFDIFTQTDNFFDGHIQNIENTDIYTQTFDNFDNSTQTQTMNNSDNATQTKSFNQNVFFLQPTDNLDMCTQTNESVDNMTQPVIIFDNTAQTTGNTDAFTETTTDGLSLDNMTQTSDLFDNTTQTSTALDNMTQTANNFDTFTQAIIGLDNMTQTIDSLDNMTQTIDYLDSIKIKKTATTTQTNDVFDNMTQTIDSLDNMTQTIDLFDNMTQTIDYLDSTNKTATTTQTNDLFDNMKQTAENFAIFTQRNDYLDNITQTIDFFDCMTQTNDNFDMFTQTNNSFDTMTQTIDFFDNATESQTAVNFDTFTETTNGLDSMTQTTISLDNITQTACDLNTLTQGTNVFDSMTQTIEFLDNMTQTIDCFGNTTKTVNATQTLDNFDNMTMTQTINGVNNANQALHATETQTIDFFDNMTQTIDFDNATKTATETQTIDGFDNMTQTMDIENVTKNSNTAQTIDFFDNMTQTVDFDNTIKTANTTQTIDIFDNMTQTVDFVDATRTSNETQNIDGFDNMAQTVNFGDATKTANTTQTIDTFDNMSQTIDFDNATKTMTASHTQTNDFFDNMTQTIDFDNVTKSANETQTIDGFDNMTQTIEVENVTKSANATQTNDFFDSMNQTVDFDNATQTQTEFFDNINMTQPVDFDNATKNGSTTHTHTNDFFDDMTQTIDMNNAIKNASATQTIDFFDNMTQTTFNFDTFTQTASETIDQMTQVNDLLELFGQTPQATYDDDSTEKITHSVSDSVGSNTLTQTEVMNVVMPEMLDKEVWAFTESHMSTQTIADDLDANSFSFSYCGVDNSGIMSTQMTQTSDTDLLAKVSEMEKEYMTDTMTQTTDDDLWEIVKQTEQDMATQTTTILNHSLGSGSCQIPNQVQATQTQTIDIELWNAVTQTQKEEVSNSNVMTQTAQINVGFTFHNTSDSVPVSDSCDIFTQTGGDVVLWDSSIQTDDPMDSDVMMTSESLETNNLVRIPSDTDIDASTSSNNQATDTMTQTDDVDLWDVASEHVFSDCGIDIFTQTEH